jgi:hypothetical protein
VDLPMGGAAVLPVTLTSTTMASPSLPTSGRAAWSRRAGWEEAASPNRLRRRRAVASPGGGRLRTPVMVGLRSTCYISLTFSFFCVKGVYERCATGDSG